MKGIYTLPSRIQISTGYTRVVFGKRGPYIEFDFNQAIKNTMVIPEEQKYRIHSPTAYYIEYRTIPDNVMIYHQKHCVNYADYKIGMLYVHPSNVIVMDNINTFSGEAFCELFK